MQPSLPLLISTNNDIVCRSLQKLGLSIKINIYRVAKDSRLMNSLIDAVHNGKNVTVVVELQARFDEEANIEWSKVLTEAGVHVIFGAPGLKIHSKLLMISRREGEEIIRYAHIGTGNFHEKTARTSLVTSLSLPQIKKSLTKFVMSSVILRIHTAQ